LLILLLNSPVSFYYDCKVLGKKSGSFSNSLDMLLQNYPNQEGYYPYSQFYPCKQYETTKQ